LVVEEPSLVIATYTEDIVVLKQGNTTIRVPGSVNNITGAKYRGDTLLGKEGQRLC
jgi:hypothetical protein